jgi:hypothetical protein
MYETSQTLTRPTRSLQPLWRYMVGARLQDLLETSEIFLTNLPTLEDQYEGTLTVRTHDRLANWFQSMNKSSRAIAYEEADKYQASRHDFYVNCWHMSEHESYLMWKAYGDRGYAIQTTFERIQCAFEASNATITGGTVQYVDFDRDLTLVGNVFNHVATKDIPYTDEREFRLVFWGIDPRNADIPRSPNGVRIPVDVKMLIRSIVPSPFAQPMSTELERLIEMHGITLKRSRVLPKV